MENMYLKHMTDAEKKIYNKNYYQRNKQYWVLWRAEHGQNGKQTGVPVAGKEQSLKGTRLSEDEIRKRKSDSYWDQYNKKAKLDYLKRNAQNEKEKWQKAKNAILDAREARWLALNPGRLSSLNGNGHGRYSADDISVITGSGKKRELAGSGTGKARGENTSAAKQYYLSEDTKNAIDKLRQLRSTSKYSPKQAEALAKANMADAQRRAAKFSGRNKPVASLPASSAPGYSKYKNDIKPLLDQKLDALKYAANIAKEKTKEVLKSIWDLL